MNDEDKDQDQSVAVTPPPGFSGRKNQARFYSNDTNVGSVIRNQRLLNDFEWLGNAVQAQSTPKPAFIQVPIYTLPPALPQVAEMNDEEEKRANCTFFGTNDSDWKHEASEHDKEKCEDQVANKADTDSSGSWLGTKTPSTGSEVASKTDGLENLEDLNKALADNGRCNKTPESEAYKVASKVDKFAYLDDCLNDTSSIAEADDNKTEPFPQYEDCSCSSCNPEDSGYISDRTTENAKIFAKLAVLTDRHQLQREALRIPAGHLAPGYTAEDVAREYRNGKSMASNTIFAQGKIRAFFLENGHRLKRMSQQVVQKGVGVIKPLVDLPAVMPTLPEAISERASDIKDSPEAAIVPRSAPKTNTSQIYAVRTVYATEEERLEDIAQERAESARQRANQQLPSFSWSSDSESTGSEEPPEIERDLFAAFPGSRPESIEMRLRKGSFWAMLNENPDVERCIQRDMQIKVEIRSRYNKSPIQGEGQKKAPESFREFCRQREAKLAAWRKEISGNAKNAKAAEARKAAIGKNQDSRESSRT